MKKPSALTQLLEDLQGESIHSDVETIKSSKAVIYLDDEAAVKEDGIELNAGECSLLFASPVLVERLVEALEAPDASICLFDLTVRGTVLEALERNFIAVDEG